MSKLDILNPVVELTVRNEKLLVRELPWPDALQFLQLLSGHAGKMIGEDGRMKIDFGRLSALVTSSQEVSEFLMLKSTGRDQAWLAQLSFRECLDVLDAALSINLSPEMFNAGKKIEGRLRSLFGSEPATSTTTLPQ
jgi:hypothetical protein